MGLFSDVYAHRAPGDTAPAANTAGCPKLVIPRGELMRHPLSVSPPGRFAYAAAMDIGKIQRVTGIPDAPALDTVAGQIGMIFYRCTETRGTDVCAIRTT